MKRTKIAQTVISFLVFFILLSALSWILNIDLDVPMKTYNAILSIIMGFMGAILLTEEFKD